MQIISDILLSLGAFGVAGYCYVLSSRLKKLSNLEKGIGGAVAALSGQVVELSKSLEAAQLSGTDTSEKLEAITGEANELMKALEVKIASCHDLTDGGTTNSNNADEKNSKNNDLSKSSENFGVIFKRRSFDKGA